MLSVLAVTVPVTGCDEECSIDWPVPAPSLERSALGPINEVAIARFLSEAHADPDRELWLGVIPGTSEQWGRHRAPPRSEDPDGIAISDEFRERLDAAFGFLEADVVRFLLVTGGAVDPDRPDYVEAHRGRDYLVRALGDRWDGPGPLVERILVDPLAETSTTNIRNADKLSVDLGLCQNLIITTMPDGAGFGASGLATQGFYFQEHELSTFDSRCGSDFGYALG